MHAALSRVDHRPWPLPARRWTWRQNWKDLLFAHWPVPAAELRHLVPVGLQLQEFAGTSWVGVVPFRMTGVMRRPLPDLPGISAFPELNVRLYVERDGIPGVWFVSLDASNALAVWAARRLFHLPYHLAHIEFVSRGPGVVFTSRRTGGDSAAPFRARYEPVSEPFAAQPGSLEYFLTERYCLYAKSPSGRLYRGHVHHHPWPLQRATGELEASALLRTHGLDFGSTPPLLHFSRGVEVVVWSLEKLT